MTYPIINAEDLFSRLPGIWPHDVMQEIRNRVTADSRKIVVIDDDPLGTQTVHDLPVLMEWSEKTLCDELTSDYDAFFVLTNSRSMPLSRAQDVNIQVGRGLAEASRRTSRGIVPISRSDSTLRGHFPGEVQALADALGHDFHAWVIIPFFPEGGRYTVDDVHYVAEGKHLVPAGETEFARDPVFGYRSSNLREWVEEKTGGLIPADSVHTISIDDIRLGGPERVAQRLMSLPYASLCIVNSVDMRDLEVFTLGSLMVEDQGKRFLFRSASSFAKVRMGLTPRPLLTPDELSLPRSGGGLIVVGSHVPRSTAQLDALLRLPEIHGVEMNVEALLDGHRSEHEIKLTHAQADEALSNGKDVVIYTSRQLVTGRDATENLSIGQRISEGIVSVVGGIATRPAYLLAKGGITSSDLATGALGIRRALVLGQILPGVPVWRLEADSKYPVLTYIVFPGNVGGPSALADVVTNLSVRGSGSNT